MRERRTKRGYKLRVYIDAIKEARLMTDEKWSDNWASMANNGPFFSREAWITYLERCALIEAEKYLEKDIA